MIIVDSKFTLKSKIVVSSRKFLLFISLKIDKLHCKNKHLELQKILDFISKLPKMGKLPLDLRSTVLYIQYYKAIEWDPQMQSVIWVDVYMKKCKHICRNIA